MENSLLEMSDEKLLRSEVNVRAKEYSDHLIVNNCVMLL